MSMVEEQMKSVSSLSSSVTDSDTEIDTEEDTEEEVVTPPRNRICRKRRRSSNHIAGAYMEGMMAILCRVELPCPSLSSISTAKAVEFCNIYDAGQEASDNYRAVAQVALVLSDLSTGKRKNTTPISSSEPLRKAIIKQFLVAEKTRSYSEALKQVSTACSKAFKTDLKTVFESDEAKLCDMVDKITGLLKGQLSQLKAIEQQIITLRKKQQRMEQSLDLILKSIKEAYNDCQRRDDVKM